MNLLLLIPILIYILSVIGASEHNRLLYSKGGLKHKFKMPILDKISVYIPIINTLITSDLIFGKTKYKKKVYTVLILIMISLATFSQPIPDSHVNNGNHYGNGHHRHDGDGAPLDGGLSILIGASAIYGYKIIKNKKK